MPTKSVNIKTESQVLNRTRLTLHTCANGRAEVLLGNICAGFNGSNSFELKIRYITKPKKYHPGLSVP